MEDIKTERKMGHGNGEKLMFDELKEKCRACSQGCIYPSKCSYFDKPPLRCMRQLLSDAADAIEELSKHRWIPVTERLPEEHIRVLVVNDDAKFMVAERAAGDWWYQYFAYDVDRWDALEQGVITHWMPLPEPPKEET